MMQHAKKFLLPPPPFHRKLKSQSVDNERTSIRFFLCQRGCWGQPRPLAKLAALMLLAALAVPAQAQHVTIAHESGGQVKNRGTMLFGASDVVTRNLIIEPTGWSFASSGSVQSFGVGDGSGCSLSGGRWENGAWIPAPRITMVHYYRKSDRYDGGAPFDYEPCRYYAEGRWQRFSIGSFGVRVYGRVCLNGTVLGAPRCSEFGPGGTTVDAGQWIAHINSNGYSATFAPGRYCGPAKWPTRKSQAQGWKPYAEWCDFTVRADR